MAGNSTPTRGARVIDTPQLFRQTARASVRPSWVINHNLNARKRPAWGQVDEMAADLSLGAPCAKGAPAERMVVRGQFVSFGMFPAPMAFPEHADRPLCSWRRLGPGCACSPFH